MPDGKALKVLPPELPKEYREFVACTRDTLEVPPGPLTWAKIPGVPDSLKPTATFSRGEGGAVKVTISAVGMSLEVDISVTKRGNLKADTSTWPFDTPFLGDQLKDLAKGIDTWIDDLNADFRNNNKKLGSLSVVNGKLTGSKVALDARVAMSDPFGGDQFDADWLAQVDQGIGPPIGRVSRPTARRNFWWGADEERRGPLVGAGAGIVLTAASGALLLFGGQPSGAGTLTLTLPPVGDPVTITGTLATTDLDFEVLNDVSSELSLTFPDNGGVVDGGAQVVYEARSSSGAAFTNTSDLQVWAFWDAFAEKLDGIARHTATGEAGGQTQTRELSPLFVRLSYDPATGTLSGGFQGLGFSYPVTGTTTDQVSDDDPGNVSRNGTFDASVLDRTDTTETVLENGWRLVVNEGNEISGIGLLRVNQAFDGDTFGADCIFEAMRMATLEGVYDPATGAVTGTSQVVAWGEKSETCTFETGVAAEDATVTGTFDTDSGDLDFVISASGTVQGPFNISASFDLARLVSPGPEAVRDTTLPLAGVAIGVGLTVASIGLGLFMGKREPAPPPPV
ncbi:MAG: hypothetical protein M3P32_04035 [Chloroflexota bacterium]|nr:hypothetical protein [Chloroflexota bacterium]